MRPHISLELNHLRVIVVLAEELNYHRVGRKVGLTQPGVTRVVAKVEQHVGVRLFERSHSKRHSVSLTDAGRSFVERAKLALTHSDRAFLAARDSQSGVERRIVVGRSPYIDRRLVDILSTMELPLYPSLRVDLQTRYAGELPACVRSGECDLAVITNPPEDPDLTTTLLSSAPFAVVLPEDHRCAKSKVVKLDHLRSTPWIFFDRQVHPTLYDTFLGRARDLGIGPELIHHVANSEEACDLVCRIHGAAFLSQRGAANAAKDGAAICTLREEGLSLDTHLVARAENRSMLLSEFVRSFVTRLKQGRLYQPTPSENAINSNCAA
ncbi:MAG TPA: LysR family transcriptional regulator [Terracidiphilus sp.]|jgi:DNA-binding transcriptional LysR family regulator